MLLSDVNVLTYHNNNGRTGLYSAETSLTPSNVNPTNFGLLYSYPTDGFVYAQPLFMANMTIAGATHNVVFVATEHDSVYAFDANGKVGNLTTPLWQTSFINPANGVTTVPSGDTGSGDIVPEIGITSTPVIDPAANTLYVVAKTKEIDAGGTVHYVQKLHALDVATGAEKLGGPAMIADTSINPDGSFAFNSGPVVNGNGYGGFAGDGANGKVPFNSLREQTRPGLAFVNGHIYIAFASHGDNSPYHGWVLGFNASNLQLTAVLNTTPNGGLGGVWQSGNALSVDAQGSLYCITGNGTFDTTLDANGFPINGDYGDSVLKLSLDPNSSPVNPNINGWGLKVADYFTPSNEDALNQVDEDFGSGGAVLLPDQPGAVVHELVATGKEGKIYLVNRDDMGHFNPIVNKVVQELPNAIGGLWGSPAYFNGQLYFGGTGDVVKAFQLLPNGTLNPTPVSNSTTGYGFPGPTPSVSADGTSHGIVWTIDATAYNNNGPAVLHAYDAANLGSELYNSAQSGARDQAAGAVKFTVPTIAGGQVFVGGHYALGVYGLLAGLTVPAAPSGLVATANSDSKITLSWKDASANETAFTILRSSAGSPFTAVGAVAADVTTFADRGLTQLTKYTYEVIATNAAGSSQPSSLASATTLPRNLPFIWNDADVGNPGIGGSASYHNGVFTVDASGNDIWNNFDQFHYVYQTMGGDGTIIARVKSELYTDYWAKAGVMIRDSLDPGAKYAFAFIAPGAGANFQYRDADGGYANQTGQFGAAAPSWVKVVRTGSLFTGYASTDGSNWSQIGAVTIPMATKVDVGLALTSHNNSLLNEAAFDDVSLTQAIPTGLVAINSAGAAQVGGYQPDADVSGGSLAYFGAPIDASGVTNPAPAAVYQQERYGTFTYTIPNLKAGGLYTVRLHFAEDYWNSAGQRIFNVSINGSQVLSNFDVFATTGAQNRAIVEQFAATADANGQIVINDYPTSNSPDQNAKSSGIEVIPVKFGGPRLSAQAVGGSVMEGQNYSATLATFVDADPGALARDYIATTNWGDGTTSKSLVQPDSSGTGYDIVDAHKYAQAGSYVVKITIQSYDGAGILVTPRIRVAEAPIFAFGPVTTVAAVAGVPTAPIVVAKFRDANPASSPGDFTIQINWSDGSPTESGKLVLDNGGYDVVASHKYASAGRYLVNVAIADDGVMARYKNTTIVVSPPPFVGGAATNGLARTPSTLVGPLAKDPKTSEFFAPPSKVSAARFSAPNLKVLVADDSLQPVPSPGNGPVVLLDPIVLDELARNLIKSTTKPGGSSRRISVIPLS